MFNNGAGIRTKIDYKKSRYYLNVDDEDIKGVLAFSLIEKNYDDDDDDTCCADDDSKSCHSVDKYFQFRSTLIWSVQIYFMSNKI